MRVVGRDAALLLTDERVAATVTLLPHFQHRVAADPLLIIQLKVGTCIVVYSSIVYSGPTSQHSLLSVQMRSVSTWVMLPLLQPDSLMLLSLVPRLPVVYIR